MIKYKGQTSALLKDVCIEMNIPVDLKTAEEILKCFFEMILKELDQEQSIKFICMMPACIKPFCTVSKRQWQSNENEIKIDFYKNKKDLLPSLIHIASGEKLPLTLKAIINVLGRFLPSESFEMIYTNVPEELFYGILTRQQNRIAV